MRRAALDEAAGAVDGLAARASCLSWRGRAAARCQARLAAASAAAGGQVIEVYGGISTETTVQANAGELRSFANEVFGVARYVVPVVPEVADMLESIGRALGVTADEYENVESTVVRRAAALTSYLYGPEGTASVRQVPICFPTAVPRDVADLMTNLVRVDDLARSSKALGGSIAIQTTVSANEGVRHIVYLPGTDSFVTVPGFRSKDPRDMAENLRLMGGRPTAYGTGIVEAMAAAGIKPGEPVLLVGHSQGGMQAAALASTDSRFAITNIVTAGSPTSQTAIPDNIKVLSLENKGDVVPLTDAHANDVTPHHVTVRTDIGGGSFLAMHKAESYVMDAQTVDASDNPAIQQAERDLDSFFVDARSTTEVFQISRN